MFKLARWPTGDKTQALGGHSLALYGHSVDTRRTLSGIRGGVVETAKLVWRTTFVGPEMDEDMQCHFPEIQETLTYVIISHDLSSFKLIRITIKLSSQWYL